MKNRAVFICIAYQLQNKIIKYSAREIIKSFDGVITAVDIMGF